MSKGILLESYSPLGSTDSPLLTDSTIKAMADKREASVSQILISWQGTAYIKHIFKELTWIVARRIVVLPKSVTPSRIKENFEIIELSEDEVSALSTFAEKHGGTRRFVDPPWGKNLGFGDGFGETKASSQKK
jgi:glycerol 2-dehydrogenase (NADP+)